MRTPLTSASLANGADVALHGITRLNSKEARTDKRTMASSQFCWFLSPAVRLDSFRRGYAMISSNLARIMARRRVELCRTSVGTFRKCRNARLKSGNAHQSGRSPTILNFWVHALSCCIPRLEILDQPQQHARAGSGIGQFDMFVRVMADAAAAAHEDHADIGDVDHRHAVMPCPARQFEDTKAFGRDGVGELRLQPWRAWRCAVFVGDVELQRQLAALRDRLDPAHDISDGALAVRIGRRANIDGERHLPRND